MADDWESLARPTEQMASSDKMRKVIVELHRKYLGTEAPKMSVRAYCEMWIQNGAAEVGPDSQVHYQYTVDLFLSHLGTRADQDLFLISRQDIVMFRDAEVRKNSAATANHKLKVLRMIFKAASDDGWTPENPCSGVKPARRSAHDDQAERRSFSAEELKKVLEACPNQEWKDMVVRSYYTGQRLKDIALMVRGQEDVHTKSVWFQTSKTKRRVILAMHPAYVDYVLSQDMGDNPNEPLHPLAYELVMKRVRAKKKAVTVTVSGQFGRILAKAGFRQKDTHRKKEDGPGRSGRRKQHELVFHSTRHSFVSHLADAGVSKTVVMDMVGQNSAQVNASYTHLESSTKREAIDKLPDITG
jgi:integrase